MNIHSKPGYAKGLRPDVPGKPRLKFGDFLTQLPNVPIVNAIPILNYPMDGNDQVGDCVVAAFDHAMQTITALLTGTGINFTQEQIWQFYQTQNPNFDPNGTAETNGPGSSADGGMNIQEFLEYLQQNKYILGFAAIDYTNQAEFQAAIYIGLAVMCGVTLDDIQMEQFQTGTWTNVPFDAVDGEHGVPYVAYNQSGASCVTWAKVVQCTESFITNQMTGAWFILTEYHLQHPNFRDSFNLEGFIAAVKEITGGQLDIPDPVAPLFSETLREGSTGPDVVKLQTILGITADGIFGPNTLEHVMLFQSLHGLVPDGIVGTKTQVALSTLIQPTPMPNQQYPKLLSWATLIQSYEGWFTPGQPGYPDGSESYKNSNPGNIEFGSFAEGFGAVANGRWAKFPTYTDGFNCLYTLLLNACTGKSKVYSPKMTLLQFYNLYAPPIENDTNNYAIFIANGLGVTIETQIETFVL